MNILGLIISYVFVGGVVVAGFVMAKTGKLPSEVVRKFIHITVSNWWFLPIFFFDSLTWAIIGPLSFILMNGAGVVTGFAKQLGERTLRRNLGLIYFPISLAILVLLVYTGKLPMWAATIGVFTMGYGDGLAALIGRLYGKKKLFMGKSVLGSSVMFLSTLIVIILTGIGFHLGDAGTLLFFGKGILLALILTVIELVTPASIDNLSVPLIASYLAYGLL